jgi:H+/gluconate symporter-like permease
MLVFGVLWLNWQRHALQTNATITEPVSMEGKPDTVENALPVSTQTSSISFTAAVLPIALMALTNLLMAKWWLPQWQPDFITSNQFGITSLSSLTGIWAIIIALTVGIGYIYALQVLQARQFSKANEAVNQGSVGSMLPILNTASEVGYGSVIASLSGFLIIREFVLSIAPGNPLISEAVAVNVLAGITGSASGGMSIALQTLGADYLAKAVALGINPELLHRIAVMASGCMDTLPHNGAVITLLGICQLSHRSAYRYIAMVTIVFPLLALAVVILLASLFGSF